MTTMKARQGMPCGSGTRNAKPIGAISAWVILAALFLTGCAISGRSATVSGPQAPTRAQGLAMEPLAAGREGFVIREAPQLDAAGREAFDQAVHLLNRKEYTGGIELLEKVVAQSPGVTAPYINLALAYQAIGQADKAETHLKAALALIPDHPMACQLYGLLCRENGRFAEARAHYEKALAHYPDYYPVHKNLAILCDLYLNDPACALEHYQRYSEGAPEDGQVRLWIADLQGRMEQK